MGALILMDVVKSPLSLELIALVVSVISVIVAMIKIWQRWSLKMAEHKESTIKQIASMFQKTEDNEKTIKEHHDNTSLKIEEIKVERERIVERINTRIERLERKHADDVDSLQEAIEKAIRKIHDENREDHGKLFSKLDTLTEKVVAVCSTFQEYKEHQHHPPQLVTSAKVTSRKKS